MNEEEEEEEEEAFSECLFKTIPVQVVGTEKDIRFHHQVFRC